MKEVTDSKTAVKCADCLHAKQFREVNEATGCYVLKVRCAKGHWARSRTQGACDLFRVLARRSSKCRDYLSMSDTDEERKEYLQGLSATLPLERIVYDPDGEPVDIEEVQKWQSAM